MFSKLLSAIMRGQWAIEPSWAHAHLPTIAMLLNGQKVDRSAFYGDDDDESEPRKRCCVLHPDASSGAVRPHWYNGFRDAPDGSVAAIEINGALTKYGFCSSGYVDYADLTKEARVSRNIAGLLYMMDTPGGQVSGLQTLADEIKAVEKPTVGFIDDGMLCSAGMWLGSACDYLYASHKTDIVGSIGVMCSFRDFTEYYEKLGIKSHEIYAPQSKDKNLDFREALEGNYDKIEAELKVLADEFISAVKSNRGDRLNTSVEDPFTGKTWFADKAVEMGLIDGICTLDQAILKAAGQS
jgi:protease-4